MKKIYLVFMFLFAINFASAYGYYPSSLSDAVYSIEPTTIVLVLLFIICFAFLNWILGRYFKDNKATAGVIAFAISALIIYGIWRNGFDIENIFGEFGVTSDLFYTILPLVVIGGIIYLFSKFKKDTLGIIGLLLLIISIFAEEPVMLWILGGILILIWLFVRGDKKKDNINSLSTEQSNSQPEERPSGYPTLKSEAKTFRNWADNQANPKMHRNWAQFISYLKNRGYGGNEKEIMKNLNVTQNDIIDVVKSYIN